MDYGLHRLEQAVASRSVNGVARPIFYKGEQVGEWRHHDERLAIENLPSGKYDLELKFKGGRTCFARHVDIVTGKVFSVEDNALTACTSK